MLVQGKDAPLPHSLEVASNSTVHVVGDRVAKFAKYAYSLEVAEEKARELKHYASQLAQEPIQVAPLLHHMIVPTNEANAYQVVHQTQYIEGPTVLRLPEAIQRSAVRFIISGVAAMSTLPGHPDVLRLGIDALLRNWQVDPVNGPTLTDIFPPLLRHADGSFHSGRTPQEAAFYDRFCGTKTGVIANMLYDAHFGNFDLQAMKNNAEGYRQHWAELVPEYLHAGVGQALDELVDYRARAIAEAALVGR